MTCQRCPREASFHSIESVDGVRREYHLCSDCAREAGLAPPPPPALSLDAVVDHLILAHVGELVGDLAQRSCPDCGMKFMEFRAGGRLGCPRDYDIFAHGLIPLLRRAQPATRHVGKAPRQSADPNAGRRLQLRSQLRQAIAREDYELAARLRDQIRHKDDR